MQESVRKTDVPKPIRVLWILSNKLSLASMPGDFLMIPKGYESQIIRGPDSNLKQEWIASHNFASTSQQNRHEESNLECG